MQLRQIPVARLMLCLSMVAVLLALPAAARAQAAYDTWSGSCKAKVTISEVSEKTGKIAKHTNTAAGILEMYIGVDGPIQNEEGYYLKFKTAQADPQFVIQGLALIKSNAPKSKTDAVMLAGAGRFYNTIPEGTDVGPVYLNVSSGTVAKDKSGNITAISLTCTMGGGIYQASDNRPFVFTGTTGKVVLTKQP